ncbi:hypothetical protein IKF89_00755 [Candidatus Saccharibacteria bacterium]|nr:hypothetical protein [Candidatus Saccharibacteria bacterium]
MYDNNALNNGFGGQMVVPSTPEKPLSSKGLMIAVVVCVICAVVAVGLGVFNSIRLGQIGQNLDKINADFYGSDDVSLEGDADGKSSCVLPENAGDIDYLMIGYNEGDNQMFVDAENEISYYAFGINVDGEKSSTEQKVQADTSAIMQQAFDEGLENYSEQSADIYDENGELTWSYIVELGTKSGNICQARGEGTPPIWFNNLVETVNSKR